MRQKLSSNTKILHIRRCTFSPFLSKKLPEKVYPLMAIVTKKWERYSFFNNQTGFTSVTFQGTIPESGLLGKYFFRGDLRDKYLAGGIGSYTTTAHGGNNSKWIKQSKSAKNAPFFAFGGTHRSFRGFFIVPCSLFTCYGIMGHDPCIYRISFLSRLYRRRHPPCNDLPFSGLLKSA
jgi:hypothetical protein